VKLTLDRGIGRHIDLDVQPRLKMAVTLPVYSGDQDTGVTVYVAVHQASARTQSVLTMRRRLMDVVKNITVTSEEVAA
jgi:hypothetical protein